MVRASSFPALTLLEAAAVALAACASWAAAPLAVLAVEEAERGEEAKVYSGPQPGEKLPPLKVVGVYDGEAGKDLDFVAEAAGKPLLLVFVHKLTRPSMLLTRLVTYYAKDREADGIVTRIVWLDKDRSAAEEYLVRARRSLQFRVPVGISPEGDEGPGAYGLNRNVALTVLVAKEGKVTASFALIEPSDTYAPEILAEVVKLIGGMPPTSEDLVRYGRRYEGRDSPRAGAGEGGAEGGRERPAREAADDPRLAGLLRVLIQKDASADEAKAKAAEIERYIAESPAARERLGRIASRVVASTIYRDGGYGNEEARARLKKWAEELGPKPGEPK
jgi:hypothetical protein